MALSSGPAEYPRRNVVLKDAAGANITNSNPLPITSAALAPASPAAPTATGANLHAGVYNTTLPTFEDLQQGALQVDVNGAVRSRMLGVGSTGVDGQSNLLAFTTLSNTAGSPALLSIAEHVFNGVAWDRVKKPNAVFRLTATAATVNPTLVKDSGGDLFGILGYNSCLSVRYLKLYNAATAPKVGADAPFLTIPLKPLDTFSISFSRPLYFSTGIGFAMTTGPADTDIGALTLNDVVGLNVLFQ